MKWIIIFVLLATSVFAADKGDLESYNPSQEFDLSIHLTNSSGDVEGATCKIQIRNGSKVVILEDDLNEIGNGWYNYTYNNSDTGIYNCRQNCTQGKLFVAGTCDFVIEGDDKVALAAIIAIILVIGVYLWIISNFSTEKLSEHGMVKTILFAGVLWMLLLPVNFAIESLGQNGATDSMIGIMSTMHIVMIYLNVAATFYLIIFMIISFARSVNENVRS